MKKIILLCLVAIMGVGVCASYAQKKEAVTKTTVFLTDIDCENCAKKITNSIPFQKGVKDVKVDVFENDILEGDIILLCSDGLTNCVEKEEIKKILEKNISLQKKAEELVKKANANGGFDNITAVLLGKV